MEPKAIRFFKMNHKDFFVLKALCECDSLSLKELARYLKQYSSDYGVPMYKRQEWCRVLERLEYLGLVDKTRSACCFYSLAVSKSAVLMYCTGVEGMLGNSKHEA